MRELTRENTLMILGDIRFQEFEIKKYGNSTPTSYN